MLGIGEIGLAYMAPMTEQGLCIGMEIDGIARIEHVDALLRDAGNTGFGAADRDSHRTDRIRIAAKICAGKAACLGIAEIVGHTKGSGYRFTRKGRRTDGLIEVKREGFCLSGMAMGEFYRDLQARFG